VYYMLYALMLYSCASVASFMFCFTGDCISHLITIAAYSFIITYLLMLYTCIHTHRVLINNSGSLIFYISYMFMWFNFSVISLEDLTFNIGNMVV